MLTSTQAKAKVQRFGRFLTNMILPNIGAFIAWGFLSAIFIPTGWWPNATLATLVQPVSQYLLPLLIGYTGGRLIAGERGAVTGAIATMGLIVGSDIPMFFGAMIAGPLGGWCIARIDALLAGRVPSGFEMLVNNFSLGLVGALLSLLTFLVIGPVISALMVLIESGIAFLVAHGLLPLTSLFVEPGKVLFLNNAINHGVLTPLGITESLQSGKSLFFLIEANPGPGFGVLLAYWLFGRGRAKQSSPSAMIIQVLGGIQEIYFPYVLMNPRLLVAVIAGGATGVTTLMLTHAGLVATASPGSILAILAMTPQGSLLGVLASVFLSALVTFLIASIYVRQRTIAERQMRAQSQPPER